MCYVEIWSGHVACQNLVGKCVMSKFGRQIQFNRISNFPGISCLLACLGSFRVRVKVEIGGEIFYAMFYVKNIKDIEILGLIFK